MSSYIIPIIILILLSGIFSGTETAFTSLTFIQVKELEDSKRKAAKLAASLAKRSDVLLTTILIGNNLVNIAASALVTTMTIQRFGNRAVGYATGILTLVILIFAEITPKQIAIVHNKSISIAMAYPVRFLMFALYPFVFIIKGISSSITSLFVKEKRKHISLEGILHVVDVAQDQGVVEDYESNLVQRVFRFDDIDVHTVMTHRTAVFSINGSTSVKEALPLVVQSGFSRIPIYEGTPEHIVGVLLTRDLLDQVINDHLELTVDQITIDPIFVPETRKIHDMFSIFKHQKQHMAIVMDEYGGLAGVVTLEDVIEELFGELYDEHETGTLERIVPVGDDSYRIMGETPIQQVEDYFDLDMKHSRHVGTVSGYIIEQTGSIPAEGQIMDTEWGIFKVDSMQGNRIISLVFMPMEQKEPS